MKRLWQSTQDGIRAQIDLLVEQACDRLMETEQLAEALDGVLHIEVVASE